MPLCVPIQNRRVEEKVRREEKKSPEGRMLKFYSIIIFRILSNLLPFSSKQIFIVLCLVLSLPKRAWLYL